MSTTTIQPPYSAIEYPEDDGQPIAENTLQFKWIVLIKEGLETLFRHDLNVFVAGDLLWYPEEGKPKIRQAPDTMVVFGRPKGDRGSYKQWEEAGIAPQVVFEVLSPGNRFNEMLCKFQFCERYGVDEYYIYDPDKGDLEGFLRGPQGLEEIVEMNGHVSPRLGIRFELGEGPNNLRIIGPDETPFARHQELAERAEAERQRAETERQRAEAERQRAEAEKLRADRMEAKLRELGIENE
jgi:Uma2 family endonuclease